MKTKGTKSKLYNPKSGNEKKADYIILNDFIVLNHKRKFIDRVAHDEVKKHPKDIANISVQKLCVANKKNGYCNPNGNGKKSYKPEF